MLSEHRIEVCRQIVAMLLQGDLAEYAARRNGLTVDEESFIWAQLRGGKPAKRTPVAPKDQPVVDDDGDDDGNDVAPTHGSKLCPNCKGKGTDPHTGKTCDRCGGSGRVGNDDLDDEDSWGKESRGYEYQIEEE